MKSQPHVLVIGGGSAGKRHARNLHALGCRISCVDPRRDRVSELAADVPLVGGFASAQEGLSQSVGLDGACIASPTAYHRDDAVLCLRAGLPVLLEKPAAMTAEDARAMLQASREYGLPVLLGYTWRWWPPLRTVRRLLGEGAIGRPLHVQFHMSAHLADWHPWEPYQSFFMAKADQGGGALLDESHWLDLAIWLFGVPERVIGTVGRLSDLEIDCDDNVDALLLYKSGLRVSVHLDLFGRPHEKSIRFVGDRGTLLWTADPNRIAIGHEASQTWSEQHFAHERNDMFRAVAQEYVSILVEQGSPTCSLEDGLATMELIEAIRASSRDGIAISLAG